MKYIKEVLKNIKKLDKLHFLHLQNTMAGGDDFRDLVDVVELYFINTAPAILAADYLHMIADIRRETSYFILHGEYSCSNQAEANEKYYSNTNIMRYYMNGLLLSQVLWSHHFDLFRFYLENVLVFLSGRDRSRVLDVGSGHGLLSAAVIDVSDSVSVVDMSEASLNVARKIIGAGAKYIQADAMNLDTHEKYDLIILGEILEHLDDPLSMLNKMYDLLNDNGIIWATIPMNAPAIDHVYLFRNKEEVFDLIRAAELIPIHSIIVDADKLTSIVGTFCIKS